MHRKSRAFGLSCCSPQLCQSDASAVRRIAVSAQWVLGLLNVGYVYEPPCSMNPFICFANASDVLWVFAFPYLRTL